jgi:uncharacterized protein YndB with AHSA1/START domain
MSIELRTSIDIAAPPERVWEVLTQLAAYPEWNPFIVRAEGTVAVGERLSPRMQNQHTLPAFQVMNQALKERAERTPATRSG